MTSSATTPAERRLASDARIASSCLELLRARGPAAVTVEAVAARSGVAKTTIYRRYRDRSEMLAAALAPVTAPESPDPTAPLRDRVRWLLLEARRSIVEGIGTGGVAALLAEQDPTFTEVIRSLLVDHRRNLHALIDTAVANGELRSGLDADTLLDCAAGSYLSEYARTGTVRDDWLERIMNLVWPAVAPPAE